MRASRTVRRQLRAVQRNLRGTREVLRALVSSEHPLLAHLIPIRRCNLACKYCNEFDDFSKPVPTELMFRRVDKLGELGTSVITISGGGRNPQDALVIGKRAVELGFSSTIGIIHDGDGQLQPLSEEERQVYHAMKELEKRSFTRINRFQDNIAQGRPNQWRCRAGARYLYICEDGLVHYCSQQRGYPAVPLEKYTVADIRREFLTEKSCAPHCTVSCVHQVSIFDSWRAPQQATPSGSGAGGLVQIE